ncbi:cytochrome c oxidase assembly protein COX18, mitochondrial [Leptinotarsa decemlineata]|uniref:cytochrome c oxidase assembly protein COX18, mitochondrial n=1 Tax=Leptinotarsa decemlineata TaxID=7539 RepID=UPI003D305B4B
MSMIRYVRLPKQGFGLYNLEYSSPFIFKNYKPLSAVSYTKRNSPNQRRNFSVQTSIESFTKTQTGIFKWLSESTPVECIQKLLLTLHDSSGLPWWGTIIGTTILLRTCVTVPLAVYQYYILAKLENLKLEMPAIAKELQMETAVAIKLYNWDEKKARLTFNSSIRKQWNKLIVRDNCHPFKASLLLWFQIPMWISLSVALRNLVYMLPNQDFDAKLTFTELTIGGLGFIPNLTEVDASGILPIALGLLNLTIIELQVLSKVSDPSKLQKILTNFFRGLSILMVPIAASVPSCLVLYWTTSSAFGLFQNMILLSPKVRRICRIPKTKTELEHPYQHIANGFQRRMSFLPGFSKSRE